MKKVKYAIITPGILPVPATKGGAVENLIQHIIEQNEKENVNIEFDCLTIYDEGAEQKAKGYNKTTTIAFKTNWFIKMIDKFTYFVVKNLLRKQKTMTYRHAFARLSYINKVSKWIKKNTYDGLLIQNSSSLFLALKKHKNYKKYANKYFYHVHNEISKAYGCDEIIRNSKKIICISDFIANSLKTFLRYDGKNLAVVKNCIDIDRFNGKISKEDIEDIKKQYNLTNEKILLFTGRLTREKGVLELLNALKKVKYENYKLLVVGSYFFNSKIKNSFFDELKLTAEKLGDKVVFTGFINYETLEKIYAISDLAILPSIWQEPAGLTIVEALASNLPLITTKSGGIPEYTQGTKTVILDIDENLSDNIAKNIDLILNDDKLLKDMKKAARNHIEKFSIKEYYSGISNILLEE